MVTDNQIADFIRSYFSRRSDAYLSNPLFAWPNAPVTWTGTVPTVNELAADLAKDAEFEALQLADLLNSPDGKLIAAGVGLVIPETWAGDYRLFVDAMTLAAKSQRRVGVTRAGILALAIVAVFLLAIGE